MKLLSKLFLLLSLAFIYPSISEGQSFTRGYSTAAYGETDYGYNYKGKQYIRGVHLPDNPNCPCPMCRDLMSAYRAANAKQSYSPAPAQVLKPVNASTELIGTPPEVVTEIIKIFQMKKDFVLLDPGCGDARILIEAAKTYGARGIGIEINPETYKIALENVKKEGLSHKINIINGDSRDYSFINADGVVMFLFPDLIKDLSKKFDELKPNTKVVSFSHDIPLDGTLTFDNFYIWIKR